MKRQGDMRNKIIVITFFIILFAQSVFAISSTYIEALVAANNAESSNILLRHAQGRFTVGNGDGIRLLYGYPLSIWSSYTTIKIDAPVVEQAIFGDSSGAFTIPVDSPGNTANGCIWEKNGISVTQELRIVTNPRGGPNFDTIEIKYIIENKNLTNAIVGLRILLDTKLGTGDGAPIAVEGEGVILTEKEWVGAMVPDAWMTLDDYYNPSILAEGNLIDNPSTIQKPDRMIVGQYDNMDEEHNRWTYTVNPALVMTDTSVALFWNETSYTSGEKKTFITYLGLPDISGPEMDIVKEVNLAEAAYGDTLSYHITYSNVNTGTATDFIIWDSLPWNSTFIDASLGGSHAGGVITWDGIIPLNTPSSVWFRARITHDPILTVTNTAFAEYTDSYWFDKEVRNSNKAITDILTPTITETHTITPTPTITPTIAPELMLKDRNVFPDPAKTHARFVFTLTVDAKVTIKLFTISGEKVNNFEQDYPFGTNAHLWDLRNKGGNPIASGVYLYKIEAVSRKEEYSAVWGKMTVVR